MGIQNRQINEEVLKRLFRDYETTLERVNKIVMEADMRLKKWV